MTVIDWVIVAAIVLLIPLGFRQGLIVALTTLVGFAVGAFVGSRVGPMLLGDGAESPYAPLTALLGGLLLGGILAVLLEGLGMALRDRLARRGAPRAIDAVGGAIAVACLVLAVSWVIGAVVLNAPGLHKYRADVQRSKILGGLNETLPPSGPILNVLNRIDPTPALRGPSADVPPPDSAALESPELRSASTSAVHVLGSACGLNLSGSGWIAGPEEVVTNAHVVAGQTDTHIVTHDGTTYDATPVLYRPDDDIAILRIPGLAGTPLGLADDPQAGESGAIVGFPGQGAFSAVAARLGTTGTVSSEDSYGDGPIDREMTSFRGKVISGNSGGPVIGTDGQVLTTVFATALDTKEPQGLGIPNAIVAKDLARVGPDSPETGTGPCAR